MVDGNGCCDPAVGLCGAADECWAKASCLVEPWTRLLPEGQVFTALLLGTSFSDKYKGQNMVPGDRAELRLPAHGADDRCWRPTFLHRAGSHEAVAFVWLGDQDVGDCTLYVAFSPLRRKRQLLKIWGSNVVQEVVCMDQAFAEPGSPSKRPRSISVPMSSYVSRKVCTLWHDSGLQKMLELSIAAYPKHTVMFTGISHGAALAQAAALQFRLSCARADVAAVTWNAYRWTDAVGSALVARFLGPRLLPFVMSRQTAGSQRHWDSVAGFPAGLAPMPNIVLLDVDSGSLVPSTVEASFNRESPLGAEFAFRALELHFAKGAIKATRLAMCVALGASCEGHGTDEDAQLGGNSESGDSFGDMDTISPASC